jgi:hypothetical protein
VKLRGVPVKPSFELNGDLDFQFKTGDAYALAAEIRKGLDETNSA